MTEISFAPPAGPDYPLHQDLLARPRAEGGSDDERDDPDPLTEPEQLPGDDQLGPLDD